MSASTVGIDFDRATVRVATVSAGKSPALKALGESVGSTDFFRKDGPGDPQAAASAVREAMQRAEPRAIKAGRAAFCLDESFVFRKIIEIPAAVPDADIFAVVRVEAAEYLPDDLSVLVLDYQLLASGPEGRTVLLVAMPKRLVEQLLETAALLKMEPVLIEPRPHSLGRLLVPTDRKEAGLIAELSAAESTVALAAAGAVWVTGTVNAGLSGLIDPATGQPDQARLPEQQKRLGGLIADECDHVLKFAANRLPQGFKLRRELLVVDTAPAPAGTAEAVAAATELAVGALQPRVALPEEGRRFAAAAGAALGGAGA